MTNKEFILDCLIQDDEAFTQIVEYFELVVEINISPLEIKKILEENKYEIVNIDTTIHIEKPMMKPFVNEMKESISQILGIDSQLLNIKATRGEKIGFVGKGEGVEAESIVLIKKI